MKLARGLTYIAQDFSGRDISAEVLEGARFVGCSFRDARLSRAKVTRCVFDGCDMRGFLSRASEYEATEFTNCDWQGAVFREDIWTQCVFSGIKNLVESKFYPQESDTFFRVIKSQVYRLVATHTTMVLGCTHKTHAEWARMTELDVFHLAPKEPQALKEWQKWRGLVRKVADESKSLRSME